MPNQNTMERNGKAQADVVGRGTVKDFTVKDSDLPKGKIGKVGNSTNPPQETSKHKFGL